MTNEPHEYVLSAILAAAEDADEKEENKNKLPKNPFPKNRIPQLNFTQIIMALENILVKSDKILIDCRFASERLNGRLVETALDYIEQLSDPREGDSLLDKIVILTEALEDRLDCCDSFLSSVRERMQ